MEAWEKWWRRAVASLEAAELLHRQGYLHSSVSRGYYAAYQAASAVLIYLKTTPPENREAWSHEETPELLRQRLRPRLERSQCNDLSNRLGTLYKLRIDADYKTTATLTDIAVTKSIKSVSYFVKTMKFVLPPVQR